MQATFTKNYLSSEDQIRSLEDAGMIIEPDLDAGRILSEIGYYRLRGYCFNFYDNSKKSFSPGTSLNRILQIYYFDEKLSHLLFSFLSKIEVSLRSRLVDALQIHGDIFALENPSFFSDKQLFWKNASTIASEISRSYEVFIKHYFKSHDGFIPIWAAVEILSFGTLSKIIKNLKTGKGSSYARLSDYYKFKTAKGNLR